MVDSNADRLALDDPRWAKLQPAYGSAADIRSLLAELSNPPPGGEEREPWF